MDKPYTVRQPADQSAFPSRAPFSTWISPNNFGDFHPNPLMSLLTGNGQIEYPCPTDVNGSTVSRIAGTTARRDTDYITRYESVYRTASLPRHASDRWKFKSQGDLFTSATRIVVGSQLCWMSHEHRDRFETYETRGYCFGDRSADLYVPVILHRTMV